MNLAFPFTKRLKSLFYFEYKEKGGAFCAISGEKTGKLFVVPQPKLQKYLDSRMLKGLPYHFRICIREDGSALVMAEYSQIIGSQWLAKIDANQVPDGE